MMKKSCRRFHAALLLLIVGVVDAVAANVPSNQKPVANAGRDQLASLGQPVILDASQSHDTEDAQVSYRWRQLKGIKVNLTAADTASPSFQTPSNLGKAKSVDLVFKLTVADSRGQRASDTVSITVAIEPCMEPQQLQDGECVTLNPALNDTGITACTDWNSGHLTCPVTDYPGQDAESGRDLTHNDDSNGLAGFSYSKIGADGEVLPSTAKRWRCVKDNVTGLIWEIKTRDGGLHDRRHTFSWYQPDAAKNGGHPGFQRGGVCKGADCDTYGFQQAVNARGLCGANDWRLPTVNELLSLVNYARLDPAIDARFFPNTARETDELSMPENWYRYWSATPTLEASDALAVTFDGGVRWGKSKSEANRIRLVRGGGN